MTVTSEDQCDCRLCAECRLAASVACAGRWRERAESAESRAAEIEALLGRLGGPGPDRGPLAQRVAALVFWSRSVAAGVTAPAMVMSYGIDPDALAAHDAAAVARARAEQAEARVAELEAAHRWVPVTERLPDFCIDVLVWCTQGAFDAYLMPSGWISSGRLLPLPSEPTHWRPLPAGPEVQP